MELLSRRLRPFLVCLALLATGCMAWRHAATGQEFRFNHQLHQSVECAGCHEGATTAAKANLPTLETCSDCHESIDEAKPPERRVATLFKDGKFKATHATALSTEVIFSHKTHTVDKNVACTSCHNGIGESTAITTEVKAAMQDCIDCHATTERIRKDPAFGDCATCHQTLRKDVKPPTHYQNWKAAHGQKAKDGNQEGMNQCSWCHSEDSCNSCHRTEAPKNHTEFWRQRGHGVAASIDREACYTCHQSDTCQSCHTSTPPSSHRGQWGGAKDKHCLSCHVPLADEGCALCHQNGTPSHEAALPTPASMVGTNCRACHGVAPAAKLPHVDNGDDCNYCHH